MPYTHLVGGSNPSLVNMKNKFFVFVIIVVLLSTACSSTRDGEITPISRSEIQNMSNENKKPQQDSVIRVKKNQEWSISLEENPTTGYSWQLFITGNGSITTISDDYKTPNYDPTSPLVGVGGIHTWYFRAEKEGEVMLTFVYERPWEVNNAIDTKVYRYLVL